jgi:predicted RNase H-like nuclease (RuvC/YqgF family)
MKSMPDSIKAKRMLKDEQYNASSTSTYTGFIAQEVEAAANKISYNFSGVDKPKNDGDTYSLRYAEFTVPLVKAVQELSTENTQLKSDLAELKKQIEELKALVQATK